MVLAEKNENPRNGRSRGGSPNGAQGESTSEDETKVQIPVDKIRVGRDYQALCPELQPEAQRKPELLADRALLVWSPTEAIPDTRLEEYIILAKDKYGYNGEQALGMLFWHKHDLDRAILDLANFTPFPDEWSVEDKVLFEQAFQFHGKSFHRIRQMLPDKTIASLVKYYYSWKKTRSKTSLMDKQARKLNTPKDEGGEDGEEHVSNEDTSDHDEKGEGGTCSNCGVSCTITHRNPKGQLCNSCHQHWRRTGSARPTSGPTAGKRGAGPGANRAKGRPPKGMHINHDDLATMASGNAGTVLLRSMDRELESLQRQIQQNKQNISSLKRKHTDSIDDLRPGEEKQKNTPRWSNEELMLATQGFKKYGKNFKAIAEMIGNKTEHYVRTFYSNYRKRYNLDQTIKEWERENGPTKDEPLDTNGEENDDVICISPSPPSKKETLKNGGKMLASK